MFKTLAFYKLPQFIDSVLILSIYLFDYFFVFVVLQMNALKNLGLNVSKSNVYLDASGKHNKFAITKA
jgi:hypothetical protein